MPCHLGGNNQPRAANYGSYPQLAGRLYAPTQSGPSEAQLQPEEVQQSFQRLHTQHPGMVEQYMPLKIFWVLKLKETVDVGVDC